ncbi:hypothetical protein F5148DRAFT_1322536 [Russula earlei]|uniref:Uncharacterized protein n=1 Tax=Russula earlei TaxID=71964 RepID=A0ACC0U1Y3_9AGAM|nr:hypothetical protein F5148DRAFT_1322536 [Russula earlei]
MLLRPRRHNKTSHKQKQSAAPIPREPLPDRPGRNVHPAGQRTTHHTPQEVAAENEGKKQAIEEKIHEGERAKELLAQMNINKDLQDEQILTKNPQQLSAAILKCGRQYLEDDKDGEVFDFTAVEQESCSDDVGSEPVKAKVRAANGALRSEIQEKEADVRGGQDHGGMGMINKVKMTNTRFTPLDGAPKQYQNAGLRKDPKSKKASKVVDPFQSVAADQYPPNPQHDHLHKNELIQMTDSDSEIPAKSSQTKQLTKEKLTVKKKLPKTKSQPADNADNSTSAEFIHDIRWANILLPTIMHYLYILWELFIHFSSDSPTFLVTVQDAFNISFPNVDIILRSDDPLVTMVQTLSPLLMLTGEILKAVRDFFENSEFLDQPAKIQAYIRWALQGDGPTYYQTPTPQTCSIAHNNPGYMAPNGFLQSRFIAPFGKQYLRYAKDSILQPALNMEHPPKGLYTVILTAVEHAFVAFVRGT